jgi:hypothetical protein
MNHHLALDFLLSKQGRVFGNGNTSCCAYINASDIVKEHADYILQQAKWLWKQSRHPNKILAPLQDMVPTLSGVYNCHYSLTCVWVLHFKLTHQVCLIFLRIHQTTDTPDGDGNDLLLQYPPWSAWRLWAPSSPPTSRKQSLNRFHHACP